MREKPRRSPLHAIQERSGATFVGWQGALWAHDFGDPLGEHFAVRTGVGLWDISALRMWEFRGSDAVGAVDWLFTNDVARSNDGQIRYGLFCDERGAIVNDGTVYRFTPERVWVITSMGSDLEHFRAYNRAAAVTIEPVVEELAAVQLQGPESRELLAELCPRARGLRFLRFFTHPVRLAGVPCWFSRIGYSGELGYELFCPRERAETLWEALTEGGARPYGFAAVETLRIEAGLLLLGADFISRRTNPYDVSLDAVISLSKGDFIGRDALAEVAASPLRRLVTLELEGDVIPARDATVRRADGPAGRVTSACRSPTLGRVIALASVDREVARPGRQLLVRVGDDHAPAVVRPQGIYDPRGERRHG